MNIYGERMYMFDWGSILVLVILFALGIGAVLFALYGRGNLMQMKRDLEKQDEA